MIIRLAFLTVVFLSVSIAHADIVILIPRVLPPVAFADAENPTPEEIDALALYNERILNFAPIESWLVANVVFTGTYEELIDYQKAPVWMNGEDEFMLFVLKTIRILNSKANPAAILGGLNALHAQKELDFTATDNVEQWLADNGYVRPETP